MKVTFIAILLISLSFFGTTANARPHDPAPPLDLVMQNASSIQVPTTKRYRKHYGTTQYASIGPRPRKWCGWWLRTQFGGGPEYNLAANWKRYGRATSPQVGAVVVWPHHVGILTGRASNGMWIVKSGNDGGKVRERARSVSGATFRI